MADTDLKVIVKAKELAVHSFKLTSNCNRYPKKYRHSLVDKIQIKSLEIYENLYEANRINNSIDKRLRCETITKGNTKVKKSEQEKRTTEVCKNGEKGCEW